MDKPRTREHVIPQWYSRQNAQTIVERFLESNPRRLVNSSYVITDVCGDCNSGVLSEMDNYGRELYHAALIVPAYANQTRVLSYQFDALCRWLLKLAYNTGRLCGEYSDLLRPYAKVVLGQRPIPTSLAVRASLVAPSRLCEGDEWSPAFEEEDSDGKVFLPTWFGVGSSREPEPRSQSWAFPDVYIDSYLFSLSIPDIRQGDPAANADRVGSRAERLDEFGTPLVRSNTSVVLPAPRLHAMQVKAKHLLNNPVAYGLQESGLCSEFIERGASILRVGILRAEVEGQDVDAYVDFLRYLASSRERALTFVQKVQFAMLGYDEDERNLWQIREVREFIRQVSAQTPPWIFFVHPRSGWLRVVLACTSEIVSLPGGDYSIAPLALAHTLKRWRDELRATCESLQMSKDRWQRIWSEGIAQLGLELSGH